MKNTYKALNNEHKSQIDDLVEETILCALQEDLEVEDGDLNEDSEDYDDKVTERHEALLKESLDYLIKRLTKLQKNL